jgi:F-box-like
MSFRRRASRLDEVEPRLEEGHYTDLALASALTSNDALVFAAACYELAHLLRVGYDVSSKQTRCLLAADCVTLCTAFGSATWPGSAAQRAALCVVDAASSVLPKERAHAVSAAFRDASVAQRRAQKKLQSSFTNAAVEVEDVLFFVLRACDARTLATATAVSRSWRSCATSPALWRSHAERACPAPRLVAVCQNSKPVVDWYALFISCAADKPSAMQSACSPRLVCSRCWLVKWRHDVDASYTALSTRRPQCCGRDARTRWQMVTHKWIGASPEHAAHATLRCYDVDQTAWNSPLRDVGTPSKARAGRGGSSYGSSPSCSGEWSSRRETNSHPSSEEGPYSSLRRLWAFPHLAAHGTDMPPGVGGPSTG